MQAPSGQARSSCLDPCAYANGPETNCASAWAWYPASSPRVTVVGRRAGQNRLVVGDLLVHIPYGRLGLAQAPVGGLPLLEDDREPRPQVLLGLVQKAEAAILPDVLDARPAALKADYALHPVDGLLGKDAAIARVTLAWQKTPIGIEAQRVLGHAKLRRTVQDDVAVIPKSVHAGHVAENIDVFDFELAPEEMATLRALDKAAPMIGNPKSPELVEMSASW